MYYPIAYPWSPLWSPYRSRGVSLEVLLHEYPLCGGITPPHRLLSPPRSFLAPTTRFGMQTVRMIERESYYT